MHAVEKENAWCREGVDSKMHAVEKENACWGMFVVRL